jgi:hypothetical protein
VELLPEVIPTAPLKIRVVVGVNLAKLNMNVFTAVLNPFGHDFVPLYLAHRVVMLLWLSESIA